MAVSPAFCTTTVLCCQILPNWQRFLSLSLALGIGPSGRATASLKNLEMSTFSTSPMLHSPTNSDLIRGSLALD